MTTSFIIQHQCPQCGAPAELEETDRLFHCGFCRVASYLTVPGFFRYVLPHKAPSGKGLIYVPYWRFKGMLFSCLARKIDHRFADVSAQAVSTPQVPFSLGFRSQTQKLHFAATAEQGLFVKPTMGLADFLNSVTDRFSGRLPKPILHQAQIGETLSMIYAPFYLDTKVYDALVNEPLETSDPLQTAALAENHEEPRWPITFIATICPQCGWDLAGQRDALALNCGNCHTTWWAKNGKLKQLKAAHIPTPHGNGETVYMPFWRIRADVSHILLESYTDLIKTANLPKVPQPGWDKRPFRFWSPAFKVRPQRLLTFATAVTLNQPLERFEHGQPKGRLQAVNMPLQEAVESLKLILAGFLRPRERMVELLPEIDIQARSFTLVYLPFREGPHELIHDGMRLAITKSALNHAKNL